ncbi:hypothetical protein JAAARDRAFT_199092 [Jaapia argillacea MUCL 33604]|uniref:Uncharacterized protein n=1 Tax=Jaapia argillacea MUCL 33604 TaxID=933084 RepID=A0A067PCC1_9AGAM|nr:hypothetical protein JAAARDRAFT_199092 [Jaapia argillacea MUCL 33604]
MQSTDEIRLSEDYVQDAFHSYLKSSLTQAKVERLLDVDVLSSAEADIMIAGPALCLYFAALRCTTLPPSVPLPRISKTTPSHQLTESNCPQSFLPYLHIWAQHVTPIQSLTPESQHDLARAICSLPPLQPHGDNNDIPRIASDLRAVAIEISQRRTFQVRYGDDLQAAIDAGQDISSPGRRQVKTSFMPPPVYEPSPPPSPRPSPRTQTTQLPSTPTSSRPNPDLPPRPSPAPTHQRNQSSTSLQVPPSSTASSSKPPLSRPPSPTILSSTSPAIELIRETLYATLADILERQPSLPLLLKSDPPRAYFASVSLAILDMSVNCIDPEDGSARGVLGQKLTLVECPTELKGFMMELGSIGQTVRQMEEEDSETVVHLLSVGATEIPTPRLDRIRWMLEKGVGSSHQSGSGRESPEGRTVAFVNRVNALALGLTRLKAFRERQGEVFKVLAGVGGR